MLKTLSDQRWFPLASAGPPVDAWSRTARAFDVGWTTTTRGERFEASSEIARERLEQQAVAEACKRDGTIRLPPILDELVRHEEDQVARAFQGTAATRWFKHGLSTHVQLVAEAMARS